jgi:hypothetical protein
LEVGVPPVGGQQGVGERGGQIVGALVGDLEVDERPELRLRR